MTPVIASTSLSRPAFANNSTVDLCAASCRRDREKCILRSGKDKSRFRSLASRQAPPRRTHMKCTANLASGLVTPLGSLLPASSPWGIWAALTLAAAGGFWSERTRLGRELSGPLIATLLGLALSNSGVIPCDAPAVYGVVNKYLLPLAVPLLLYSADMRRVLGSTGRLLIVFAVGSAGTVAGTLLAMKAVPLRSLGSDAWKVAAALAARHIGGAVNYVAVAEATGMSASAQAAGLAADNLSVPVTGWTRAFLRDMSIGFKFVSPPDIDPKICAVYFTTVYHLARHIGPDLAADPGLRGPELLPQEAGTIKVLEASTALAISATICYVGSTYAVSLGTPGFTIPVVTALTVCLATLMPKQLAPLVPSAEGIAQLLMNIFFATVGAAGSIATVIRTAPSLFVFCLIQIGTHLGIILSVGSLLSFSRRDILLASNANVGGPTTAAGMCAAKGWRESVVPVILIGTAGYACATFVCIPLGQLLLAKI